MFRASLLWTLDDAAVLPEVVWWRRYGLLVFPQSRFARFCAGGGSSVCP